MFQATQAKTFSATIFVIGVMPERFAMVQVDGKLRPSAPPVFIRPEDITRSSVDGFGGGLRYFLTADLGDITFETASAKYKLLALGGGLDRALTGDGQMQGKAAFLQFLAAARGVS